MAKINILSEIVSNQIAAGEVVERPIAVVKELIENSLDAGASQITIRFSHGGKQLIVVEDNGCGMDKEDALMAFKRHATSKISTIEDISTIGTFGFRGEALPSIASVSRLTMRTRRDGEGEFGHEICYNGGKFEYAREFGMPRGTIVQVEHLFHNIPARRKFLKTDQTESDRIVEIVKNFAFAEKLVRFELYSDGRKNFQSPVEEDWAERASQTFCPGERLLPLSYTHSNCSIFGAVCDPDSGTPCRRFMSFFVNRRPVESKLLRFAVMEALDGILPRYREVIACLLLHIDSRFVDVNVHPMKREVKFRNEQFVRECIQNAIATALHVPQRVCSETVMQISVPQCVRMIGSKIATSSTVNLSQHIHSNPLIQRPILRNTREIFSERFVNDLAWKFIGKMFDNCAIFESPTGMIVFNIRLATRRILFEQIKQNAQPSGQQGLFIPIDIFTNDFESNVINTLAVFFAKKNVEIYQFGKNHHRVSSIPTWLSHNQTETFVRDVVQSLAELDFNEATPSVDEKFSKIASKYARYEQYETGDDIIDLARKLLKCDNFLHGSNGETPFFEMPKCDFLKRFPFL
ncbi:MAG: DNA mismatch repair endonuclease MutL [Puniceicoccales bacterium]|nr:DNA mismatch repair endonuclease MutL [Puniceicoccales bacterium]